MGIETRRVSMGALPRMARVLPDSLNEDSRTFDVVASTGAEVRRFDFMEGEFIESLSMDAKAVRLDRLKDGRAPFLESHERDTTSAVLGNVKRAWLEDGELRAEIYMTRDDPAADAALNKIRQGVLGNLSIAYQVDKFEEVQVEDGQPRHLRAVDWTPFEISLVAVGADAGAVIRARSGAGEASTTFDLLAGPPVANPEEIAEMESRTDDAADMQERIAVETAKVRDEAKAAGEKAAADARNEATAAERQRIAGITTAARKLKLSDDLAAKHVEDGTALEDFRALAIDEAANAVADPAPTAPDAGGKPAARSVLVNPVRQRKDGEIIGGMIRALAAAKGDEEKAIRIAEKAGDAELARAMAAGVGTAGGFMVPEVYSAEIIELLRARAVVRSLGARTIPMPGGNIQVPKITGGAAAEYIGENVNLPATEPTTGQLRLTARKLGALVPISNDLIRFASPNADAMVRDDLVAALAEREDAAFIRDVGSGNAPKGLRYWAPAANVITVNATVNLANVTTDLGKLVVALKNSDVRFIAPAWLMAPRTENYLMTVRDGNGNFAFRDEMLAGRLWGYAYGVTTQIPINLAVTDTDESEVYLVDMADAVIGEVPGLILDTSSEAAYHDGSNVVAAYSLDQTVIRAITQHDFGMRHDASVAVLSDVDWT